MGDKEPIVFTKRETEFLYDLYDEYNNGKDIDAAYLSATKKDMDRCMFHLMAGTYSDYID